MVKELIVSGKWERAKRAIAACKNIDEVKKIRDKAEALRAYAKQAREGLEVQNNIAEIKLRAERRIGEFSRELPKEQGDYKKDFSHDGENPKTTKLSILKDAGINHHLRYEAIADLPEETFENHIDEVKKSHHEELTTIGVIKLARKLNKVKAYQDSSKMRIENNKYKPIIKQESFEEFLNKIENASVDLLLTDPPYSTDIKDIYKFAEWVKIALPKIKPTGRAYICIGAYPQELEAYLSILNHQDIMVMSDVLIWTYRNTLGPSSKMSYNQNWQAILYLYGKKAENLACPLLNEQFAVQDINAPDGRTGIRYHKFEKPIELAKRFICHSTNKDDLVIDCFAGTGTFILAATDLGRQGIGCDISSEMIKIAKRRGCIVE